jgi:hypothetical protein
MMISILKFSTALPFCVASILWAADYTITVSVSSGTISNYTHDEPKGKGNKGSNGHQRVTEKKTDTITWQCDTSCTGVGIAFKAPDRKASKPLCNPLTPSTGTIKCVVDDFSGMGILIFPYTVAATYSGGVAIDDPDVIVDPSSMSVETEKGTKKRE